MKAKGNKTFFLKKPLEMVELELHRGVGGGGQQQQQQQQQHPPLRTRTRWRRRWSISAASRQQQQQQQQHFRSSLRGFGYLERERAKSRVRQEEKGENLQKNMCPRVYFFLEIEIFCPWRRPKKGPLRIPPHPTFSSPRLFFCIHEHDIFPEGRRRKRRSVG